MASTKIQTTGNTPFTGTQYTKALEVRLEAMKQFAEGTVDEAAKNAARAQVRQMRKAITSREMTVQEWREAEAKREEAKKATRRSPKATQPATPAE